MTDRIFLGHTTKISEASITRPANTNAYAAGDVIADADGNCVVEFTDVARSNAGSGMIMSADVIDFANKSTQPSLELWLFTAAPDTVADNAPFAPSDEEMAAWIGKITLSSATVANPGADAAGSLVIESGIIAKSFKCAGGTKSLFGVYVVRNAYTPVSGEVFMGKLSVLQDY